MPARNRDDYNDYMSRYMLNRYQTRMAQATEKLGGVCVHCSSIEDLQFDHIDPKTKLFTIAKGWSVSAEKFWAEVAKCQLLCRPCHEAKTLAGGDHVGENRVRGSRVAQSKLTEKDVLEIRRLVSEGMLQKDAAILFSITRRSVGNIIQGHTWDWLK